ncbi:unnamed protein product, partial [Ranitomeya imitator]
APLDDVLIQRLAVSEEGDEMLRQSTRRDAPLDDVLIQRLAVSEEGDEMLRQSTRRADIWHYVPGAVTDRPWHINPRNTTIKHDRSVPAVQGIIVQGPGQLIRVHERLNGAMYREILSANLLPSARSLKMKHGWVFQHDNDSRGAIPRLSWHDPGTLHHEYQRGPRKSVFPSCIHITPFPSFSIKPSGDTGISCPLPTQIYQNLRSPFYHASGDPPNLRDNLVKADIGSKDPHRQTFLSRPKTGTFLCLHCAQCNNIQKGNTFPHPDLAKHFISRTSLSATFHIKNFFICESSYVMYLIKCPCGLLYIGETTQPVRDRISKHKSTIRCSNLLLPIPYHFHTQGHSVSQLKYQVIDHVPPPRRGGDRITLLKKKEAFWIHTLESLSPKGLIWDYELMAFV